MSFEEMVTEIVDGAVRGTIHEVLVELSNRPLVLTADQTAELLSVSRRTVETWVADGVLPRMPHTSRLLIPRAAVEAWVAGVCGRLVCEECPT